jgi:high mobility group protein B1
VAKLVSEAWKDLPPEEREKWEGLARRDKARYDAERVMYKGPWKVPANKRTPKDPSAPKRPMSAFLAFSNSRRAMVKRQNPESTNAEISKTLSNMWKEAPDDIRQQYIDEEYEKRQQYKVAMADWRKKYDEEKRVERQAREEIALRAAEESEHSEYSPNNAEDNESTAGAPRASYPTAEADGYLTAASQQLSVGSSLNAGSQMYGAGMGSMNPYFSALGGYGSAFGSSMGPLGGRLSDVEQQIAAYNQLGQLNSMFSKLTTSLSCL